MSECQVLSNEKSDFSAMLSQSAFDEKIPLKATFELTARCNFNCEMCYVHLNDSQINKIGRELTNDEWLEIARQAKDAGTLYMTLTGGEVFARPHFRELYEELTKMGFLIQILSNGYLIDESVIEWLKENPPYILRFTLYGMSNQTYEKVCGIRDGFDRVMRAIDLVEAAGIPLYLVSTVVKENEQDLPEMYAFARERNIVFQHSISVVSPVRGAESDAAAHRINITERDKSEWGEVKKRKRLFAEYHAPFDVCGSYRRAFWVTWNGNMQLCAFMEYPTVSLIGITDLTAAWDKLLSELDRIKFPEKCGKCKYEAFCQKCPGMLAAECGSPEKTSDAFCAKAKKLYEIYSEEL